MQSNILFGTEADMRNYYKGEQGDGKEDVRLSTPVANTTGNKIGGLAKPHQLDSASQGWISIQKCRTECLPQPVNRHSNSALPRGRNHRMPSANYVQEDERIPIPTPERGTADETGPGMYLPVRVMGKGDGSVSQDDNTSARPVGLSTVPRQLV